MNDNFNENTTFGVEPENPQFHKRRFFSRKKNDFSAKDFSANNYSSFNSDSNEDAPVFPGEKHFAFVHGRKSILIGHCIGAAALILVIIAAIVVIVAASNMSKAAQSQMELNAYIMEHPEQFAPASSVPSESSESADDDASVSDDSTLTNDLEELINLFLSERKSNSNETDTSNTSSINLDNLISYFAN